MRLLTHHGQDAQKGRMENARGRNDQREGKRNVNRDNEKFGQLN